MNRDYPPEIDCLLDKFHNSANAADFDAYFSCFAPEGSFLGTDAHENWSIPEFKEYCRPRFCGHSPFPVVGSRKCTCLPSLPAVPAIATFDEILFSPTLNCGLRGSGVLIFESKLSQWLILSYHLSFNIPDGVVPAVTKIICAHYDIPRLQQREAEAAIAEADLLKVLDLEDAAGNTHMSSSKKASKKKKKK